MKSAIRDTEFEKLLNQLYTQFGEVANEEETFEEKMEKAMAQFQEKLQKEFDVMKESLKKEMDTFSHVEMIKGARGEIGEKGDKGDSIIGVKGNKGESGERGEQGIRGERGEPGTDGTDGTDGKDGYTPVKGKDYFDGVDGSPDTPDKVINKIHESKKLIKQEKIQGFETLLRNLQRAIQERVRGGGGGGGTGNWVHQSFSTSSAITTITLSNNIAANGFAIMAFYNGQFIVRGTHYTQSGKVLTLTFTPQDSTNIDVAYVRT